MEDLKNIEELLLKFYDGETSLEEDRKLMWFFQTQEIPERLKPESKIFRYYYNSRHEETSGIIEEKISRIIDEQARKNKFIVPVRKLYWISSIAAVLLLALTLWFGFGENGIFKRQSRIVYTDTYQDPARAYMETKKALMFVSEKMNTGTKNLQPITKIDKGIRNLAPVLSFSPGVQQLEKLSKFNEATELITKK